MDEASTGWMKQALDGWMKQALDGWMKQALDGWSTGTGDMGFNLNGIMYDLCTWGV